jgi:hypothetical protein
MIVDSYDHINLFEELVPKLITSLWSRSWLSSTGSLGGRRALRESEGRPLAPLPQLGKARGRHSTPVEVILRMLVVKRLYNWSYEPTPSI